MKEKNEKVIKDVKKNKKKKDEKVLEKGQYDATNIQILEGTEAVRMRPAMSRYSRSSS